MRSPLMLPGLIWALATCSPAGELTGRVLSERKGVVGATVAAIPYESPYAVAMREASGAPRPQPIATVATAAEGRFKLTVPATAPPFVVQTIFGGLAARTVDGVFEKSDSEDLGDISLARGETLRGRIVDPGGKPVPGALIRIGRDGATTTSNKEGLFRFDDVEGRTAQLFLSAPTLSVQAVGFEVQGAPVRFSGAPLTVRLKPSTGRFGGVLKDWGGKSAPDAVVRLVGDVTSRWVRTDAAGRFEIQGAPPKLGRLQALGKDGSSLEATVSGGTINGAFTLTRAATLEGRVTEAVTGKLVPAVKVAAKAGASTVLARTGVDGRYRISGLSQGVYRVTFDEKRFVLVDRREVEVGSGELKILDIALTQAVALVGRVVDDKGQPVAGALGTLSPGTESRIGVLLRAVSSAGQSPRGFVSGLDGSFKAERLSPGTNQKLTVSHPDFERRVIPGVDLVSGALKPVSLEVVLSPGYVLAGVVKDKDGHPVEGAGVAMSRSLRMQGGRGNNMVMVNTIDTVRPQSETDFEGKFTFKGLSAGEYDLTVSKLGFTRHASSGIKAGDGSAPIEVTLDPGAAIAGRLVQPNGQPVTGYSVAARPSAAAPNATMLALGGGGNNLAQVDPDGGFVIEGLIPGTSYDLSLFGTGEFRGDAKKKSVLAPASNIEIEVAARGRIAGRVIDSGSGSPITEFEASYTPARAGGMMVVVRGIGNNERRTPFASPDGTFAFEDVPPGNWDVTVWAKTYQEARTAGIAVAASETKAIEVKATRGLVIRGRVVDAKTGRGVQDAAVTAKDGGGGAPGVFVFDASGGGGGVVTDADGRFEIVGQSKGSYQLTARHSQFSEGTARVALEDKDSVVEIPVAAGGTIAGLVTSSQGAPLSGAEVSLQSSGDGGGIRLNGLGLEGQSALTDGLGRFRFEHLPPARYKVAATLRTEASPVIDVPLNADDVREDLRLALDAGATVRGVVTGLPETERSGVMVSASGSEDYFANTRTNADGSFEFAGVPKGALTLRATTGDILFGSSHTAQKELTIAVGQTEVTTEIAFDDGLSISGTVLRRGAPVVGARVSAFMTGTGRQASGRVDESGAFKITGLEPGRVTVVAFAENFASQVSQVVELKSDTSIELVIPTAKLSGAVLDAVGGLPLESSVELQRSAPVSGALGGRLIASTDSSGRFAFDDLDTVDYRLTARRSGYESVTRTVKPTEAGDDLRIELKRGAGLSLEAKDAQMGFGLRGLFVRVQQGANEAFAGPVSLDGEGKGEIPGIPPGTYSVTAQASGYAPLSVPNVSAPQTVLRLAFSPGGTVEFRTTEEFLAEGPKSGQILWLTGAPVGIGAGGPGFRISRLTQRLENLTPGRYRLALEGGIDKPFEITEGGVTVVTIP